MGFCNNTIVFALLWSLTFLVNHLWICQASDEVLCIPSERQALLSFKRHLLDRSNRLSSWSENTNCCNWTSVVCNDAGHIFEIHLKTSPPSFYSLYWELEEELEDYRRSRFGGEIHPSILDLRQLSYLDLSYNDFGGIQIPGFLGSMKSLTYLNLSYAGFSGSIPHQIGNLSRLHHLDLGGNHYTGNIPNQIGNLSNLLYLSLSGGYQSNLDRISLFTENLQWLSSLSSLQYLMLSSVNMSAFDWLHVLQSLPTLTDLHLQSCALRHQFHPSITINFSSLAVLDISYSFDFGASTIPKWVFQLKNLVSLQLRQNHLQGFIPNSIQNLTLIEELDLSSNLINSSTLDWLYGMKHLKSLRVSSSNLHGAISNAVGNLTSLITLDLSNNQLEGLIPDGIQNLTLIEDLDLSYNLFNSSIPDCLYSLNHLKSLTLSSNKFHGPISNIIGNLTSMVTLDLSYNQLEGPIPNSIGNMTSVVTLDLSSNQLEGPIPRTLRNLCNLRSVDFSNIKCSQQVSEIIEIFSTCGSHTLQSLSFSSSKLYGRLTPQIGIFKSLIILSLYDNSLRGVIPISLGNLTSLIYLDLSENQLDRNPFDVIQSLSMLQSLSIDNNLFHGVVNQEHLANFTKLNTLSSIGNKLTLKVGPYWNPSFRKMEYLYMSSWHLGPQFPSWIQSLKHLRSLYIPNNNISDSIPAWVWDAFPQASYFDFSNNDIYGELYDTMKNPINVSIDLSSNRLIGHLPSISPNVFSLDLSSNWFSGSIASFLCQKKEEPMGLEYLNLASNNLSGEIPDCWMMWPNLMIVKFDNNHFSRNLPLSLGSLPWLSSLRLRNNTLSGNFPICFRNSTRLVFLDLSENQLSGTIPLWVGHVHVNLKVFLLRTNKFIGGIPSKICSLNSLQILDLAQNQLTGQIPKCINNLTAILVKNNSLKSYISSKGNGNRTGYSITDVFLALKGRDEEYDFPGLITSIDLSDNKLTGEIPSQITNLMGLHFLNLSNNHVHGEIPQSIGNMGSLQSMDFSNNKLCGKIPSSISNLNFLNKLNLSSNNLTGKIPTGTQLQSFEASSFMGNDLCGPPLPNECTDQYNTPNHGHNDKETHGNGINWFYVSMSLGFVSGFWVVIGPLLYNRSWRYTYFRFLDCMWYKLQSCWF